MRNKSRDKNPQRPRLRGTRRLALERTTAKYSPRPRSVARYRKKFLTGLRSQNIPSL